MTSTNYFWIIYFIASIYLLVDTSLVFLFQKKRVEKLLTSSVFGKELVYVISFMICVVPVLNVWLVISKLFHRSKAVFIK